MEPCKLVYLDVGTNVGDSILAFANGKPERRVKEMLHVAVGHKWSPRTTCVYGFEPNPRHTRLLHALQRKLAPQMSNLTIYTETAVGGPEQLAKPMWLDTGAGSNTQYTTNSAKWLKQKATFASLTTTRPTHGNAKPVPTFSLSGFLRRVCLPQHGERTPVVIRMDIEGVEYDVLSDLATSGIGRLMDLFVTVEWHRGSKEGFLGPRQRAHMSMLDDQFLRYPYRCGTGQCTRTGATAAEEEAVDKKLADSRKQRSFDTLEGSLEKSLAFFLHRAGITYVDAYFAVSAAKVKSFRPQDWNATRERRSSFSALAGTNDRWVAPSRPADQRDGAD